MEDDIHERLSQQKITLIAGNEQKLTLNSQGSNYIFSDALICSYIVNIISALEAKPSRAKLTLSLAQLSPSSFKYYAVLTIIFC